jgi:hypothetical protein
MADGWKLGEFLEKILNSDEDVVFGMEGRLGGGKPECQEPVDFGNKAKVIAMASVMTW